MKTITIASACASAALAAVLAASAAAQAPAAPAVPATPAAPGCYIEVPKLMAAPPAGIGDLGEAIRSLDVQLRPQVEEIGRLKTELDRLEMRQRQAMSSEEGDDVDLPALEADMARVTADLDAKQAKLKSDYAAQQAAIVGPVQTRVSARAQAFATQRKCAALKMARAPDLAALQTAGAVDVTGEFVTWYAANPAT